jgi:hypothetical protein
MLSFLSRDILKNDINLTKYGNIIISVKELKVNRVKKEGSNGEKKQTYFK